MKQKAIVIFAVVAVIFTPIWAQTTVTPSFFVRGNTAGDGGNDVFRQ